MGYHEHECRLEDGTDISRMTVDEITVAQRKLSPKFPDINTVIERRQNAREALAARILIALAAVFGIGAPFAEHPVPMALSAALFGVGFVITCFVAGARKTKRQADAGGLFDA